MNRIRPHLLRPLSRAISGAVLGMVSALAAAAQDTVARVCRPTVPPQCSPALPPGAVPGAQRARPEGDQPWFEFMVDKPVTEAPGTSRPAYPPALKQAGVTGEVLAQFVVDTFGAVEPHSIHILRTSHPLFAEAVNSALPNMKYVPAEVRGRTVRQLVQQPFVFAIAGAPPSPNANARGARVAPPPSMPRTTSPAPPRGTVPGWSFAQRITVDSGDGRTPTVMTIGYAGTGEILRQQIESSSHPGMGETATLMNAHDSTTTMFMGPLRTAMVMRMPDLGSVVSAAAAERAAASHPAIPQVTKLGRGEPMFGQPTTHSRTMISTQVSQTFGGFTCTRDAVYTTETWRIPDPTLTRIQLSMAMSVRNMLGGALGDAPTEDALAKAGEAGSTVRSLLKTVVPQQSGAPRTVTMETEVLAYKSGEVDAALFAIPAGFAVQDMRGMAVPRPDELRRSGVVAMRFWSEFDSTATRPNGERECVPAKH